MGDTPNNLETITKEWLEKMLQEVRGHPVSIESFTSSAATKKGDNFVSLVASVKIITTDKEQIDLIMKLAPEGEFSKKFFTESLMFEKEARMYKQLTKDMTEFQMRRYGKIVIDLPFPKCYYVHEEEDGRAVIVMEDLRSLNYKMFDKTKDYDLQHVSLVLKGIAKLHALTFAYSILESVDLGEKYPWLKDTWMDNEDIKDFFVSVFNTLISVLKSMPGQEDSIERIKAYTKTHKTIERYEFLVAPRQPLKLITHGDFWNNNMMFQYDQNSPIPKDFMMIDLQICKLSSPSSDLVYFLYSSTGGEFRKKHLSTILRMYYDSFMENVKLLGMEFGESDYPFQQFVVDFDEAVELGFLLSSMVIPFILSSGETIPDMNDIKDGKVIEFLDDWNKKLVEGANENTKRRVLSLVEEVMERKII